MQAIRRYAREVAEKFDPDKIVLFGSYAYGHPRPGSDVDLGINLSKAAQIELACAPPFPADIIVRTPSNLKWRLEEGESFHTEILSKGKVLYEKGDSRVGSKGRSRLPQRRKARARR
jgi:predicted nucleotidyltransferase